jgi:hypothetical protein
LRPAAIHVVGLTSLDLDLHSRVRDLEAMFDVVNDSPQHLLSLSHALLGHDDMTTAGDDARADHPDVQIVDVEHPRDTLDRADHSWHVQAITRHNTSTSLDLRERMIRWDTTERERSMRKDT